MINMIMVVPKEGKRSMTADWMRKLRMVGNLVGAERFVPRWPAA